MAAVSETLRTAVELHRAGRLAEAESLYGEIVRVDPSHADALHLLGVAAHQRADHRRAVELIRRAIAAKPSYAPFHGNLSAALRAMGLIDEAIASCETAIQYDSRVAGFHFNLGNALTDREEFERAVSAYERAVALDPNSAESWNGLSLALTRLERLSEAVEAALRAVSINPRAAEQHLQLGNALRGLGRSNEAAVEYLRAVSLRPDFVDAHVNLGAAYEDCGRISAAVRACERALNLDPTSAPAHFNRALAWLRSGDFSRGWTEYEWRWKHNGRPRRFSQPEWDGEASTGSVLVYSEQGIGDEVQFASCLPDAIARAGQWVIECDPRLVRLFARSFPSASVIPRTGAGAALPVPKIESFESQIAIGSLPKLFRKSITEFPKAAYLVPDSARVDEWKERYRALGGELTVGICWRGGKDPGVRRLRSTALSQWTQALQTSGVSFVNLQYGDCRSEIDSLQREISATLHDWNEASPLGDLDAFAARVAAADLVISVDNSTVHLAGAMGLEVWTLLPFASDWRWMLDCSGSPWYPNVRLFRQPTAGDWSSVFETVAAELRKRLERTTTASAHSSTEVDANKLLTDAVAFHQTGKLDEAERAYRELVRIAPQDANGFHLLGVLCCQRGDHNAAINRLSHAIVLNDTAPIFHWNLALAFRAAKRNEQALASFNRVIELDPRNGDAWIQKGLIHQSNGQLDPAIECFAAAIAIDANNANSYNCLGGALQSSGRLSEAAAAYRAAVRIRPDFGPFHFNLANALREADELDGALASYTEALRLVPDDAEARANLGVLLRELGRFDEASACCEELITSRPDFAAARFNRSLVRLQQGWFAEGWDEYEWRWQHGTPKRETTRPWDGSPLNGRSLLILAEQGIGDEIMFSSCVPDITSARCALECDPRLTPLFARSFPQLDVIAKSADGVAAKEVGADVEIPIGSLPRILRRSIEAFPARESHLVAAPEHLREWRSRLAQLPQGLKVGISWRGGKEADVRRKRSTSLTQWKSVLNVPGVTVVNLQYGDCRQQLDEAHRATGVSIHEWHDVDPLRDLDFFAAQIAALDLVVSVDNSTVHLAGALGTPVWTLLPFAADWRWLHARNDSPWYRSMHLFRQREPGNWTSVFEKVAAALGDLAENWPLPL